MAFPVSALIVCSSLSDLMETFGTRTNLRRLEPALTDIVPAEDPLVARDAVDGVLTRVQELAPLLAHSIHAVRFTHDVRFSLGIDQLTELQLGGFAQFLYTCYY